MDGAVAIGILHVGGFVAGVGIVLQLDLFHVLHDAEIHACAQVHLQIHPAAGIIVFLSIPHGVAAVVDQIQGYGIHRGGVGQQVFAQGQLTAEISNIRRTGIAYPHGLVGIVILDAIGVPVRYHKIYLVIIREPGTGLGGGGCVGGHDQTVIVPAIVPGFRRRGDVW